MTQQEVDRSVRLVTQYLQSLQRAGVAELPIPPTDCTSQPHLSDLSNDDSAPMAVSPQESPSAVGASSVVSPPASAHNQDRATHQPLHVTDSDLTPKAAMKRPQQEHPPLKAPQPSQMSRSERVAQLQVLAETVAKCTRCEELCTTRTQTVFGVGHPEAKIMFIGEAPGADEDRQGEPFVGRAGQLLNQIITASRLTREEIYICNILRCRPPSNRTPSPEEAANCREYLDGQIRIVDPDYIVCWGAVAAQNLLQTKTSTGKLRGEFLAYGRAKVLCTYHPAYLLRNPDAKKHVWDDMKFLMRDMGIDLSKSLS